ncbi:response regulator transcription factor [Fredinandcohnia sp. 179-A 10B2 NHS]|uniref:response regulator transcription factor n=1 Tax=Fredinandcohnia sp. 179-A 10B2 NHS TaxID=3235176 RepID=UPI0039A2575C
MKKVLLVDDELFIRKGLKSLIDWEKCGFEVVSEADNGEDAFNIIKNSCPDLVITDIRMPILDGLELIKRVVESEFHTPKFIIISGFNDFKYAQHAIRYGVQDFILKPIDQDEMEEALQKLAQSLREEENQNRKQELLRYQSIFEELLVGTTTPDVLEPFKKEVRFEEGNTHNYVLLEVYEDACESVEETKIRDEVQKAIAEILDYNVPVLEHSTRNYGFIINSKEMAGSHSSLENQIKKLSNVFSNLQIGSFSIYVGSSFIEIQSVKESFETAKQASLFKFICKENEPVFYETIKDIRVNYSEIDHEQFSLLMEYIEEHDIEHLQAFINSMFTEFQEKYYAPEAVKGAINHCVQRVIKTLKSMEESEQDYSAYYTMLSWNRFNLSPSDLKKQFTTYIIDSTTRIHQLRKEHVKGDIHKIKAYTEKHYHENISLKGIASKFYINPVYMGQLFKKTYGIYFKEFLLDIRIKEAKKLLRQTNQRVYEVAEKVGFGSTDYFVTQFEKMEGMSPTEYRNQILK